MFRKNELFYPDYYFRTATATFYCCWFFQLVDFLYVRFLLSLGFDVSARVCFRCGGCLSSQLFQLCFPCGCAVQFFGVMRCDRFFLFPSHVGSHLSGGLLPLFFESRSFCFWWFFARLIAAFWGFSGYAQLSVFTVCASSVLRCVLRSLIGYPFSIRCPWLLLLFLVSSEVC